MVNPIRSVASKLLSAYAQRNLDFATDPRFRQLFRLGFKNADPKDIREATVDEISTDSEPPEESR